MKTITKSLVFVSIGINIILLGLVLFKYVGIDNHKTKFMRNEIKNAVEQFISSDPVFYKKWSSTGAFENATNNCLVGTMSSELEIENISKDPIEYKLVMYYAEIIQECGGMSIDSIKITDNNNVLLANYDMKKIKINDTGTLRWERMINIKPLSSIVIKRTLRVGTKNVDRYIQRMRHLTGRMSLTLCFPSDIKVDVHFSHVADGFPLKKEQLSPLNTTVKGNCYHANINAGILPFQGVEFSWAPDKDNRKETSPSNANRLR